MRKNYTIETQMENFLGAKVALLIIKEDGKTIARLDIKEDQITNYLPSKLNPLSN